MTDIISDNNTTVASFSPFCDPSILDKQRRRQMEHWLGKAKQQDYRTPIAL
jgi:hypothetical protein